MQTSSEQQLLISQQWVAQIVVGLNLCPFAKPVLKADSLRYAITQDTEYTALSEFFLSELEKIQLSDEGQIATTLIIVPNALADFYDYLDFLAHCEQLINKASLEGEFQLASFHPQYVFAGESSEAIANYTNRSPYPMLHIIREAQMSRVLENHPDPDSIPNRNIQLLQKLGKAELIKKFPPLSDY